MPPDPDTTLDSAPDPNEDTQADESQDTEADSQGNTVDWETRYREAQKLIAKQGQELGILRGSASVDDDGDDEEEEPEDDDEYEEPAQAGDERLVQESFRLAEQIYGREAIKAYERGVKLLNRATTPADHVAAFEAYHQARIEAMTRGTRKADAAQGESSPQPRVDSNRPDASPRNDFDRQAEEAFAKGDSLGFFQAAVRKVRGE